LPPKSALSPIVAQAAISASSPVPPDAPAVAIAQVADKSGIGNGPGLADLQTTMTFVGGLAVTVRRVPEVQFLGGIIQPFSVIEESGLLFMPTLLQHSG
jgi:hypothetical protein